MVGSKRAGRMGRFFPQGELGRSYRLVVRPDTRPRVRVEREDAPCVACHIDNARLRDGVDHGRRVDVQVARGFAGCRLLGLGREVDRRPPLGAVVRVVRYDVAVRVRHVHLATVERRAGVSSHFHPERRRPPRGPALLARAPVERKDLVRPVGDIENLATADRLSGHFGRRHEAPHEPSVRRAHAIQGAVVGAKVDIIQLAVVVRL